MYCAISDVKQAEVIFYAWIGILGQIIHIVASTTLLTR